MGNRYINALSFAYSPIIVSSHLSRSPIPLVYMNYDFQSEGFEVCSRVSLFIYALLTSCRSHPQSYWEIGYWLVLKSMSRLRQLVALLVFKLLILRFSLQRRSILRTKADAT